MGFFDFVKEGATKKEEELREDEFTEELEKVVKEAFILMETKSSEVEQFKNSQERKDLEEEGVVTERTIVKLDKKAKLAQLEKIAILQLAKEAGDKYFKKFVTWKKTEKMLEEKMSQKYGAKAQAIARKMLNSR